MAGIGFRLEKILSRNTYASLIEAYGYAGVVSAGPLLCTIVTIAALMLIMPSVMVWEELLIFRTLVVYIYGASLITTSVVQMIITRFMSDRIFIGDYRAIVPAFVGAILPSLVCHAVVGAVAVWFLHLGLAASVTAVVLFLAIGVIWIAMIVLSAAKEFAWITRSFAAGSLVSVGAGYLLGKSLGLVGLLSGFTVGQVLLVSLLLAQVFAEFEYRRRVEFLFLSYFRDYASLIFIATLYNIGIWVDKVLFWFSPGTGDQIHAYLRASSIYDVPVFVAYLLIVPSLAMFTVRIETDFYVHYKKFYLAILAKHPLSALEERRQNIVGSLRLGMGRLVVLQATLTLVGLFLAPKVYPYLGMSAVNLGVFQIAILATFLQALLLALLIVILYFDFRADALVLSILFAASNTLLTWLSIRMGFPWYGYGYFGSCLLSVVVGFLLLDHRLKHLLFYTFVGQKVVTRRAEEPAA